MRQDAANRGAGYTTFFSDRLDTPASSLHLCHLVSIDNDRGPSKPVSLTTGTIYASLHPFLDDAALQFGLRHPIR
jgi:hypothetical protein